MDVRHTGRRRVALLSFARFVSANVNFMAVQSDFGTAGSCFMGCDIIMQRETGA